MISASSQTERTTALHALIERHRGVGDRIYAVADAARDHDLAWAAFDRFGLDRWSLFPADTAAAMRRVAPYLIPVPFGPRFPYPGSGYLELWATRLWGARGILVSSPADPRSVWEHLRELFLAVDEEHVEYYFRFYDPRVLRGFLPTLAGDEVRQFYGPIQRFFVEGTEAGEIWACRRGTESNSFERIAI